MAFLHVIHFIFAKLTKHCLPRGAKSGCLNFPVTTNILLIYEKIINKCVSIWISTIIKYMHGTGPFVFQFAFLVAFRYKHRRKHLK